MRTRIENVTLLCCDTTQKTYTNSSLTFENDRIIAINEEVPYDICIDGENGILMPGMINTHTHLSMIPFRSLQDDLPDRLRRFLFPLEKQAMTQSLAVSAAKIGVAESLLSGVTTLMDMYYYSDALASTYDSMGIRALVAQTIVNQNMCDAEDEREGFNIAKTFYEKWVNHSRIIPAFGPHGTTTLTKKTLIDIQSYAQKHNALVCMHVAEMDDEMAHFRELNTTPIEFLNSIHLLDSNFISVHTIHPTESDIKLLSQHNVGIAHCIGANIKAAKGIAPLKSFIDHNIRVGLGTDGPSSGNTLDLFVQMNLVAKCHKVYHHDRKLFPAKEIVQLATLGGASVLHLDHLIGSLEVGKKADLVLIETDSINMYPNHDPYSLLVYSANASNVHSVWVDGIQKVNNKKLVDYDLKQLKDECDIESQLFNQKLDEINQTLNIT